MRLDFQLFRIVSLANDRDSENDSEFISQLRGGASLEITRQRQAVGLYEIASDLTTQ